MMEAVDLTRKEVEDLPEYQAKLPAVRTVGMRWKRRLRGAGWVMGEYIRDPRRNARIVGVTWKYILVRDQE